MPACSSCWRFTNNVVPFSLIFAGQTELGAGVASVLNATTPFWTLILANALTSDEKLSWNKLAGIALGIAGTAVMIGPGLLAGLGGPVWAKFALIGASLSYARRADGRPPLQGRALAGHRHRAADRLDHHHDPGRAPRHGPAGLFSASPPVWAAVLALALLSTAFAYILYFNLVASAGATNASLVTLIVPASAMLLGFLFLGRAAGTVRDRRHGADRTRSSHDRRTRLWKTLGRTASARKSKSTFAR